MFCVGLSNSHIKPAPPSEAEQASSCLLWRGLSTLVFAWPGRTEIHSACCAASQPVNRQQYQTLCHMPNYPLFTDQALTAMHTSCHKDTHPCGCISHGCVHMPRTWCRSLCCLVPWCLVQDSTTGSTLLLQTWSALTL